MGKYINPFNDTGFKIIFGQEKDKEILISFLNNLLEGSVFHDPIVDITYLDKEKPGDSEDDRTMINDIHCRTKEGRHIIVEMQNRPHLNFTDRMLVYGCRAIVDQVKRGDWDYKIESVYSICFTNFFLDSKDTRLKIDRGLCDFDTREPVSDRLRFIYIQLPAFTKTDPEDCDSDFERWIFTLKNLTTMQHIPFAARDRAFERLQQVANEASLTPEERRRYRADEKQYLNIINIERSRFNEGIEKGLEKGRKEGLLEGRELERFEVARRLIALGMDADTVFKATGVRLGDA